MNRTTLVALGAAGLISLVTVTGCSSSPSTNPVATATPTSTASTPTASTNPAGIVLPVSSNPIRNTASNPVLEVTYAAVEDNVDPISGKAISDRLELTLKNSGTTSLSNIEVYYAMTDVVAGAKEGYYQKLDGLSIAPGAQATVYFDNKTGPGHYPENQFSIYRSSTNEVDFAIQVSAPGAKIAIAKAVKSTGTGEKVD